MFLDKYTTNKPLPVTSEGTAFAQKGKKGKKGKMRTMMRMIDVF
jgi:hypothetical protein